MRQETGEGQVGAGTIDDRFVDMQTVMHSRTVTADPQTYQPSGPRGRKNRVPAQPIRQQSCHRHDGIVGQRLLIVLHAAGVSRRGIAAAREAGALFELFP